MTSRPALLPTPARLSLNENGAVVGVNAAASVMLGQPTVSVIGQDLGQVVKEHDPGTLSQWLAGGGIAPSPSVRIGNSVHLFRLEAAEGDGDARHYRLVAQTDRTIERREMAPEPRQDTFTLWANTLMACLTEAEMLALVRAGKGLLPADAGVLFLIHHADRKLEAKTEWGSTVIVGDDNPTTDAAWSLRLGRPVDSAELPEGLENRHVVVAQDEATYCTPVIARGVMLGLLTTRRGKGQVWDLAARRTQDSMASLIGLTWARFLFD